jgi:hypothetical protein
MQLGSEIISFRLAPERAGQHRRPVCLPSNASPHFRSEFGGLSDALAEIQQPTRSHNLTARALTKRVY